MFRFGILQRHVVGQVARAFALGLVAITAIFVLIMVMAEATRQGLDPRDIAIVVPYIIPGTLPYTIPVALLFAVSVVYGQMAGNNEVVAIKTAGLSAMTVLWPSLWLGLALSAGLAVLAGDAIPRANHHFKALLLRDVEDLFYKKLANDHEWNNPGWPFFIRVGRVEGRTLHDATFKRRVPGRPDEFDTTVRAAEARVSFDFTRNVVRIDLVNANIRGGVEGVNLLMIDGKQYFEYPIPERRNVVMGKRVQEKTNAELNDERIEHRGKIVLERKRQAVAAAFKIAAGRFSSFASLEVGQVVKGIDWEAMREASSQHKYWELKVHQLDTEQQLRVALAFSSFFFVLLGAPVGIRTARRDYLSSFIVCFLPIMIVYYPLMLGGVNLGTQGIAWPHFVWLGNLVLGALAGAFALPPVIRH